MMTSSSHYLNIKGRHGGFDVRADGDEKQIINFAWPKQLSSASVEAAINFVEVCNEHTAVIGGRSNTSDPIVSTCKLFSYVSINLVAVEN